MRFVAVAIDYDGTLAQDGLVSPSTVSALEQVVASGRKLILVTGRILDELLPLFPQIELCHWVVAENGAVLYRPATREHRLLTDAAAEPLIKSLQTRAVVPLKVGQSVIATVRPHEIQAMEAIRDLGLEHHVVFNGGSVMVLPPGITKASGLKAALSELRISPHNVIGIGDGENDHALLQVCELAVAVRNAVPTVREAADWVTAGANGHGIAEVLSAVVSDDGVQLSGRLVRHHIALGDTVDGATIGMSPVADNVLIAGTSASGKSTLAHALVEQLIDRGYQVCVIDPEGDYESIDRMIVFGNPQRAPTVTEILTALEQQDGHIVVNLVGLPLNDRPAFFSGLLTRLQERRALSGRPHRILVDEAHHLLPAKWHPTPAISREMTGLLFVTVHPDQMSSSVLRCVDIVIAMGDDPLGTVRVFAAERGMTIPAIPTPVPAALTPGCAVIWRAGADAPPTTIFTAVPRMERQRHRRKYAEGELPPDRSFYFRGPKKHLNLRARNLIVFRQLAEGVDDATWLHHLRQGDYSRWIAEAIKDRSLAHMVRQVEIMRSLSARESRRRVADAIEERYTSPSTGV